MLFAFDAGQEFTEHTTPFDAPVMVLEGSLALTIDGKELTATPGPIVRMPSSVPWGRPYRTRFARRSLRECSCSCSETQPERTARRVLPPQRLGVSVCSSPMRGRQTGIRCEFWLSVRKIQPERGDILETRLASEERKS
jgi:hypothetical protein